MKFKSVLDRVEIDNERYLTELEKFIGDFVLENLIAATPKSLVYKIRSARWDETAALKISLLPLSPVDLERFQHEIRLLSEVSHPNVIRLLDYGVLSGGLPFICSEALDDIEITAFALNADWNTIYDLAIQIAAGLVQIHRYGLVHLDIKPANLGIKKDTEGNTVLKIMDFGLSQYVRDEVDSKIRGTLAYTAPEVILKNRYDHRADLYSLGMTLFQLTTGILPSAGDDESAIRFHLQPDIPDPLTYRPDIPLPLANILKKLLAKDPEDRFQNAGELLDALVRAKGEKIDVTYLSLARGKIISPRLVGRKGILSRLGKALRKTSEGESKVIVIVGEEGIGKSRLLREFKIEAALKGFRVGLGGEKGIKNEPFKSLKTALEKLLSSVEGGFSQFVDEETVVNLLEKISFEGPPLVLLLDDLHLAHESTLNFLQILSKKRSLRVLVVATVRGRSINDSPFSVDVEHIEIPPLDLKETEELIKASVGIKHLDDNLSKWCFKVTRGVPGEILRLIRHLVNSKVLSLLKGQWIFDRERFEELKKEVPRLSFIEQSKIKLLDDTQKKLLALLSVVKEGITAKDMEAILDIPLERILDVLESLLGSNFVEVTYVDNEERFTIASQELEEWIYGSIKPNVRKTLHFKWGEYLLTKYPGSKDKESIAAEHLWQGGEFKRAIPMLWREVARLRISHRYEETAAILDKIARASLAVGDTEGFVKSLYTQAEVYELGGFTKEAINIYLRILNELDNLSSKKVSIRRGKILVRLASLYPIVEEYEKTCLYVEEGLKYVDEISLTEILQLKIVKAYSLFKLGEALEGYKIAREVLRKATKNQIVRIIAESLFTLGSIVKKKDSKKSLRIVIRALKRAKQVGDRRIIARSRLLLSRIFFDLGNYEEARRLLEENLSLAKQLNHNRIRVVTLQERGFQYFARGRFKEAYKDLVEVLQMRKKYGMHDGEEKSLLLLAATEEMLGFWNDAAKRFVKLTTSVNKRYSLYGHLGLVSLARKRGEWEEAEDRGLWVLARAEKLGDKKLISLAHRQLGILEKDKGNLGPAAAHLFRSLELIDAIMPPLRVSAFVSLGDLFIKKGDLNNAAIYIERALKNAKEINNPFEIGKLLMLQATLTFAKNNPSEADDLFDKSVKILEKIETPYEYALALYNWGVRSSHPDQAIERLRRALIAFDRLGAVSEVERVKGAIDSIRERRVLEGKASLGRPGLWEMAKIINSTLNLQEVLNRILDIVINRIKAERGMIVFVNQITGELEIVSSRNILGGEEKNLSETVIKEVIETRTPLMSIDALRDPRFKSSDSIVASHIRSIICVPLLIKNKLVGAIYVDHRKSHSLFGKAELEFTVAFADQAAIAIENARLYGELEQARARLFAENEQLKRDLLATHHLDNLIGKSKPMVELKATIQRVAPSNSTVLLTGETGTGKGVVARIIHYMSPRKDKPFIHFNCAALPESLIESELFGHEKGAFTGAVAAKPGRFELADKGTIFLDEIGKISLSVQSKLLRAVEEKEFERVGGTKTLKCDVRIVAATNIDLREAVKRGEFREDLYYRLNVVPIFIPPLRDRKEDIPFLVDHFIKKICKDMGKDPMEIEPQVLELFMEYDWPGNVRELEAAIHRAIVLTDRDRLTVNDFSWIVTGSNRGVVYHEVEDELKPGSFYPLIEKYEKMIIEKALVKCGWRIRETAKFLGISRNTLKAKLKKYAILVQRIN